MNEKNDIGRSIMRILKKVFSVHTNGELWVRFLFIFVIINVIGIGVSLIYFFNIRGIVNDISKASANVPDVAEVDKGHITEVLRAFSVREGLYERRAQEGVSIGSPY